MPFVAQCTFCGKQMRLPDHALGWSVRCPKCHDSFTAAPLPLAAGAAAGGPRPGPRVTVAPPAAAPTPRAPAAVADPPRHDATATAAAAPTLAAAPPAAPPRELPAPLPDLPAAPAAEPERLTTANLLGVAALFLAAVSLMLASLSSTQFLTLPLAGLALGLGVAACLSALASGNSRPLVPAAGAAGGLLAVLLAVFWLGLLSTLPFGRGAADLDSNRIQAIPLGSPTADAAGPGQSDWVDASRAAVQQNDIRVEVVSAGVAPVEVARVQAKPTYTAQKYLLVRLRTLNVGAARRLPYDTWNAAAHGPQPPSLTDSLGKSYALKSAEPDWQMTEQPRPDVVAPGRFADELLVFELPPADVEFLHLELPAAACGGRDTYRLAIPRAMIRR